MILPPPASNRKPARRAPPRGAPSQARLALAIACVALAGAAASPTNAQDRPPIIPAVPAGPEITPEVEEATRAGLRFLADRQARDGGWEGGRYRVAVSALAGLAFLATGSTPSSGEYARAVRRLVGFLLSGQAKPGRDLHAGLLAPQDDRPMYGHGFALHFLGECMGMTPRAAEYGSARWEADRSLERERLLPAVQSAVDLCARSQSTDGGWYYTPDSRNDEGSVTITQIQGLRAARNAGILVKREVIDRAVMYVRRSQDADGGIRYTVRSGRSSLALTVAGLSVLFQSGEYGGKHVDLASGYVRRHLTVSPTSSHFEYTHFYASQVMFQLGGRDWRSYYPRIRSELLRTRRADGSWTSSYGDVYATALSVLILAVPYRYLPSFTR